MKRPWLWLPPNVAHRLSPWVLSAYGRFMPFQTLSWQSFSWRGLEFTNPLGIAGGLDKDGRSIEAWWTLGAGFLEIGTITPRAQPGHSGKRMARDRKHLAIWNKMGFPSQGVEAVIHRLKNLYQPRFTPIFANIGKNAATPLENAVDDYVTCLHLLNGLVDGFVINLSSPNTQGLRDLLTPDRLQRFLEPLLAGSREMHGYRASDFAPPLLLKISPDLSKEQLEDVLLVSAEMGMDGFVITNSSTEIREGLGFPEDGGVSGQPLAQRAKECLKIALDVLGDKHKDKLIVSCGGVMTPADVFERLSLGANLVQVYSALIFDGPFFFRHVAELAAESRL